MDRLGAPNVDTPHPERVGVNEVIDLARLSLIFFFVILALSRDPECAAGLCKRQCSTLDPGSSPGMTKRGQQHRPFKLHRAGSIVCAGLQILGVVIKVIAQERSNEVIAVVIPRLHAQGQRVARCLAGGLQQFGAKLG